MPDIRLDYLFGKYFDKTATAEERAEFMQLIVQLKSDDPLFKLMESAYNSNQSLLTEFTPEIKERILANVFHEDEITTKAPVAVKIWSAKTEWIKYAAVLFIVLFGASLYFYKYKEDKSLLSVQQTRTLAAGGNKAILILGNGKRIVLDAAANGILYKSGNIAISKTANGQLVYNIQGSKKSTDETNSIETPKGGQYQVNLPDGTKVWLNAASRLTYPVAFSGPKRIVELFGEAYFEVAKNPLKPFNVMLSNHTEINVLGTHFNVSAYSAQNEISTTLLEGSVLMKSGEYAERIVPGQQAQVNKGTGQISLFSNINLRQVMAWKNGFFSTESISLHELMHQVENWYDVEVIYKDAVEADFVAKLPRNVPLPELLRLLELTKQVKFKLEGRTITVMK